MPPESFRYQPASLKGDIWAVGCIIYEAITGTILFDGETKDEIKNKVMNDVPRHLPVYYSRRFRGIIWRMLRKNPTDRPSTDELLRLDFLQKFVQNTSVEQQLVRPEGQPTNTKTSNLSIDEFRFTDIYDRSCTNGAQT